MTPYHNAQVAATTQPKNAQASWGTPANPGLTDYQDLAGLMGQGNYCQIQEPTIKSRAEEIEKVAADIENGLLSLKSALFADNGLTNGNLCNAKDPSIPTVEDNLRNAATTLSRIQSILGGLEQKVGGR